MTCDQHKADAREESADASNLQMDPMLCYVLCRLFLPPSTLFCNDVFFCCPFLFSVTYIVRTQCKVSSYIVSVTFQILHPRGMVSEPIGVLFSRDTLHCPLQHITRLTLSPSKNHPETQPFHLIHVEIDFTALAPTAPYPLLPMEL